MYPITFYSLKQEIRSLFPTFIFNAATLYVTKNYNCFFPYSLYLSKPKFKIFPKFLSSRIILFPFFPSSGLSPAISFTKILHFSYVFPSCLGNSKDMLFNVPVFMIHTDDRFSLWYQHISKWYQVCDAAYLIDSFLQTCYTGYGSPISACVASYSCLNLEATVVPVLQVILLSTIEKILGNLREEFLHFSTKSEHKQLHRSARNLCQLHISANDFHVFLVLEVKFFSIPSRSDYTCNGLPWLATRHQRRLGGNAKAIDGLRV